MTVTMGLLALAVVAASPPTQTVNSEARVEAADKRQLYALVLTPARAWKLGRPFSEQGLRPHFDYWMGLFRAGRIATAGPLGSDSGLVLLFAVDLAEAEAIMRADPAIKSGIFEGSVRRYAPPMINPDSLGREKKEPGSEKPR